MSKRNFLTRSTVILTIFALTLLTGTRAVAQTEKVLHNFNNNGKDGEQPRAGLIFDTAGNLYGTTEGGGAYGVGTAFELVPVAAGDWNERILFTFDRVNPGALPYGGLILDGSGNLYGTTREGAGGGGLAFELSLGPRGGWTETVLRDLGDQPFAGLIFDGSGNLYGTTFYGGTRDYGTVFELTPAAGSWTDTELHSFNGHTTDGFAPTASLIFDGSGNLYGTTAMGGAHSYGTVFELTPVGDGSWSETILHSFEKIDGDGLSPQASLIFDSSGNLYSTTVTGGAYGGSGPGGTVFELTPVAGGGWTETLLHSFGNGTDGSEPVGSLIFDGLGNLYGTTVRGGAYGDGTVFELTPAAGGSWTETVLHSFGHGKDGSGPASGLIFDGSGNLYGTTGGGGAFGYGTVFEITP